MSQYATYVDWKEWKEEDFLKVGDLEKKQFELEFGSYVHQPDVHTVLEVGFGNGNVLGWLKSIGKTIEGVEVNEELVSRAEKNGIISYGSILNIPIGVKYDIIFALDVLEHVPAHELESFFLKVSLLLSDQGKFIARFPNGDSPFALPTQNGDLTHVTPLGWHRVSHLARVANLNMIEYRGEKIYSHSFTVHILRIILSIVRSIVADVLLRLFFPRMPSGTVTFRYVNIITVFKR